MKVSGAELVAFMDGGWPEPHDDWYWDHEEFSEPIADALYDTDAIGPVLYQGDGDDPTKGEGYDLAKLIRRWRKERDCDVLVVTVAKDKINAARDALMALGADIK